MSRMSQAVGRYQSSCRSDAMARWSDGYTSLGMYVGPTCSSLYRSRTDTACKPCHAMPAHRHEEQG